MPRSYIADGDIRPCRFVSADGTKDNRVVESDANSEVVGISQEGGREAPLPGVSTVKAAAADESLMVYELGERCLLELGENSVTPGALLKSDADGKGVDIATTGTTIQKIGARAEQGGDDGDKVLVTIVLFHSRPALS